MTAAAVEPGIVCDNCEAPVRLPQVLCPSCVDHKCDEAVECAVANGGYLPEEEVKGEASSRVRGWLTLERIKPASSLSAETIAAIERMAEDLEVG